MVLTIFSNSRGFHSPGPPGVPGTYMLPSHDAVSLPCVATMPTQSTRLGPEKSCFYTLGITTKICRHHWNYAQPIKMRQSKKHQSHATEHSSPPASSGLIILQCSLDLQTQSACYHRGNCILASSVVCRLVIWLLPPVPPTICGN